MYTDTVPHILACDNIKMEHLSALLVLNPLCFHVKTSELETFLCRKQLAQSRAVTYKMSNNCNVKLWAIFIYLMNSGDFIHTLKCCSPHVTFCVNRDNIVDCIQCKVRATYFAF
jgi:hypothetical protein